MPFGTVRLIPGVNTTKTPVLNEAGISSSNLIRFREGLVQKLGGWVKYYGGQFSGTIRRLHAWAGLSSETYLAVGGTASLSVLQSGNYKDITPQTLSANISVQLSTTIGSAEVIVRDVGRSATVYDVVSFLTPVSVGGIVLSGVYSIDPGGANTYTITTDTLATANVVNGGAVPTFTTVSGSSLVTVTLNDHQYAVNDTVVFLASTTANGIVMQGQYVVTEVLSANTFTVNGSNSANASSTVSMNGGSMSLLYYIAQGPQPPGVGYGIGGYGRGGYGTGNPPIIHSGTPITATDWTLDNWGNILIASPAGGAIYTWSLTSGFANASVISAAPLTNGGVFVAMPQRQLIAWGSTTNGVRDPLLVRWCDIENYNQWVGTAENSAGQYRLTTGSEIIGALQAPQRALLWTDVDVWSMQFIGGNSVYGFTKISSGCGLIARNAYTLFNTNVYWMTQNQFYVLSSGGGVQQLPCPIWDVVFQDIDKNNLDKITAAANSHFNEILWYYPSRNSGGVVDSYIKYNDAEGVWDFGKLARTAWIDQSVLGDPIGAGTDGYLYQHEVGYNSDTAPMTPSFTTGYTEIGDGVQKVFIDMIIPDMRWGEYNSNPNASVKLTFYVVDYPGDTPTVFGPYTVTSTTDYINVRLRGRFIALKVESADAGSFWRMGAIKYRLSQDGRN